jgi:hypothetical protein
MVVRTGDVVQGENSRRVTSKAKGWSSVPVLWFGGENVALRRSVSVNRVELRMANWNKV